MKEYSFFFQKAVSEQLKGRIEYHNKINSNG